MLWLCLASVLISIAFANEPEVGKNPKVLSVRLKLAKITYFRYLFINQPKAEDEQMGELDANYPGQDLKALLLNLSPAWLNCYLQAKVAHHDCFPK